MWILIVVSDDDILITLNLVLVAVHYRHTMAYVHHPQYCRFPGCGVSLLSPKSLIWFGHLGVLSLTFKRVYTAFC